LLTKVIVAGQQRTGCPRSGHKTWTNSQTCEYRERTNSTGPVLEI